MPIYRYTNDAIDPVEPATFSQLGIAERNDLQRLLRDRIDIIAPDTLVIAEEFGNWEDSRRRIDLLAIDRDANLVVIELKRTEDGGHMELQALRYAAMVSTLTFERAVEVFEEYLKLRDDDRDPERTILEFLSWDEPQEDEFGSDSRIVLASAEFSKELTTAVLWLCDRSIDIRCVRLRPYGTRDETFLDVQQVIPLPEATDYQIRVREKQQKERASRRQARDTSLYTVSLAGTVIENLSKRRAMLEVVRFLCGCGVSPEELLRASGTNKSTMFRSTTGELDSATLVDRVTKEEADRNRSFNPRRYFTDEDELIYFNGRTYCLVRR